MSKRIALFPALLLALLVIVATALTWMNFSQALPRSQWAQAAWSPDIDVIEQMIFHYSLLPRLAISLLVGAGLGLPAVRGEVDVREQLQQDRTNQSRRRLALLQARNWGLPSLRSGRSLVRWRASLLRWQGLVLLA